MTLTAADGGFLWQLVARGEVPGYERFLPLARQVAERWRQAVAGGDEAAFHRRLAWDSLPQGAALVERLARGLAARQRPRWLLLLQRQVAPHASCREAASSLARWVRQQVGERFPRDWPAEVAEGLELACRQELAALLELSGKLQPAWELFSARPVVARWVGARALAWAQEGKTLLARFAQDRQALAALLDLPPEQLVPVELRWGLGDRHETGRVVALLFPGAPALYFKPRSLQPELVLDQWWRLFRGLGLPLAPLPAMVARPTYGWVREVRWVSLAEPRALAAWFRSAGALAAVAWVLGLGDLHWENVVASGEGPVVVDGEGWAVPATATQGDPFATRGVLATGLFSMPALGPSGLREDGALAGGAHPPARSLPLYRGAKPDPAAFVEELAAGVQESLVRLSQAARRSGFGAECFAAMEGLRVRWVARPSEVYARFLRELCANPRVRTGWHASLLAEATLRPVVASSEQKPPFWRLLRQEQRALLSLAVPRLTLSACRRGGVVRRSGRELIAQRLAQLDAPTIAQQVELVRQALSRRTPQTAESFLREQASRVAAELQAHPPEANPSAFLRRGLAGRALAWAAWARASGDGKAEATARKLYAQLLAGLSGDGQPSPWPLGFPSGVGGVVYSLAAGAALLGERSWLELARQQVEQLSPEAFPLLDVEGGVAGLLLGTYCLLAPCPELAPRLVGWAAQLHRAVAQESGNGVKRPGFAHGLSGVAAALSAVGKAAGEKHLLQGAWELLLREPDAGRWWAKAETPGGGALPVVLHGWCHGAPGAFLGRLLAFEEKAPELLSRQMERAATLTLQAPLSGAASLCCGSIACSEILLIGAQVRERDQLAEQAMQRTELFLRHRPWRGELSPEGGLFDGLYGLLFHLSRLLSPREVGSVLAGQVAWRGLP